MNYSLFLSTLAIAAVLIYRFLILKNPFWLYIPGILASVINPLAEFKHIEWSSDASIPEGEVLRAKVIRHNKNDVKRNASVSTTPNIIFIVADDLGSNDLSFGNAGVATPNIDSIGMNGVKFTSAYAGHATCAPSRASIFTGRYASRFGFEYTPIPVAFSWALSRPSQDSVRQSVFHFDKLREVPQMADMVIPSSEIMISDVAKEMNFSTVYIGKWHLGESEGYRPQDRGYDETLAMLKGAALYYPVNHPSVVTAKVGGKLDDFLLANLRSSVQFNGGRHFEPDEYMTDYLANQAAAAIRAKSPTSPLFMTVAFNAPHSPFQAKREDFESPEIANITNHVQRVYAAMIKALDRGVGTILKAVEESGKADNTLIIFTSDNGGPGTNYMPEINAPFRGWKATLFEGGVRVPFLMQWPKQIPAGVVYDRPISHVDMFATAAVAAGVSSMQQFAKDTAREYDGVDLVKVIQEHVASTRAAIRHNEKKSILPWKRGPSYRIEPPADPHNYIFWRTGHYIALRTGDWKLQVSDRPNKIWFFDLAQDPTERTNLAAGILWSELRSSKDVSTPGYDHPHSTQSITAITAQQQRLTNSSGTNCTWQETISHGVDSITDSFVQSRQAEIFPAVSAVMVSSLKKCSVAAFASSQQRIDSIAAEKGEAVSASFHSAIASMSKQNYAQLLSTARLLLETNAAQAAPLWPALAEIPVPVDGMGYSVPSGEDEYIYWSN